MGQKDLLDQQDEVEIIRRLRYRLTQNLDLLHHRQGYKSQFRKSLLTFP